MAGNRKLGKTTDIRLAMLKTQATCLLLNGKLETTEARAKEVKPIADSLISLAIKEKDNFEMVDVKVSKAKLDEKGHKVTELVKSKNGKEYLKVVREEITEKRKKDMGLKLKKYITARVREYWMVDPDKKKVVVYDLEHNELPAIYGFEDQVPVKIFAGKCQIDFSEIYSYIEFLFEKE